MNRNFLIIPEITDLESYQKVSEKYNTGFEYNDFARPNVYMDKDEVKHRIKIYKNLNRDFRKDTMHGAFIDMLPTSLDKYIREYSRKIILQNMEVAKELNVHGIVFHTNLIAELNIDSYIDPWLDSAEEFWREVALKYPNQDIYMENTFEQNPQMLINIKERLSDVPNFKLCLDYGHAILTRTPIETWINQVSKYVGHIHLNDNDLVGDLHLVPGSGKIDFNKCKKLLNDNIPNSPILLELNGLEREIQALLYIMAL